jgi:hypothetical protein
MWEVPTYVKALQDQIHNIDFAEPCFISQMGLNIIQYSVSNTPDLEKG